MKNDTSTGQRNSPTKSGLVNKKALPVKGLNKKIVVDEHGMSECNTGATALKRPQTPALKRPQTPINLFEDECVFCHSFRTSLQIHGPMVNYLKGRLVPCNKGNPSNIIYVHQKCLDWAPRVWYKGDNIMNLESEINRASKLRCSRCKQPGAALGCHYEPCRKSFHVPCAVMTLDCRWDVDGRHVLCPEHASEKLPCDETSSPSKESDNYSSLPQSQCSVKEEISKHCQMEYKRLLQVNTSNSSYSPLSLCLNKQEISSVHKREDQQVNQITTSSSSLPRGQHLEKQGNFAYRQKENTQMEQLNTSRSCPMDQWVLLGSELCASEKDSLKEFADWTNATVAMEWAQNVTHVVVGKNAGSAFRSYEVLMAVLFGRWVVRIGWIMDRLEDLIPGPETSYEVKFSHDSHTTFDGPMKGRIRAAEGAPKLFSGLCFCLSAYMNPEDREQIRDLIAAAGGEVLEVSSSVHSLIQDQELGKNQVKPYFVYNGGVPPAFTATWFLDLHKEMEEGIEFAARGAQVISHLKVLDAIAAYDAQVLDHRDGFTPYLCA